MQPLPSERYEMRVAQLQVVPDYHVTVDYMRYSVPFHLIGEQVDVRLSDTRVTVMSGGGAVAGHARLRGRKGQYSTLVEHMPPAHATMDSPWSRERFVVGAPDRGRDRGGRRPAARQQARRRAGLRKARNILGLSKSYSPQLLERACPKSNALGAVPSYTALKNAILAIRADADERASGRTPGASDGGGLVDRAKSAEGARGRRLPEGGGARC